MTDTIFAPATAPGRAAVAVVRLSGPEAGSALKALGGPLPAPRRASVRRLKRPADHAVLDDALVLWMPGPSSYTGEDSVELHLHGGAAVVEAVSSALAGLGLRMAEPGEFTRRAFENGRLDLAQAEAVADLVDAETDAQRAQALQQLDGALSALYGGWRAALVAALARLEAAVDFPDEDLPETLAIELAPGLADLVTAMQAALAEADRGERVREGFRVALIGAPNSGKSSLLNALTGRDAAIVDPSAGTTRDIIEAPLVVEGFKVLLADMAGLRAAVEPVEAEGVRRARAWATGADLRIWVVDRARSDGSWAAAADLARPGDIVLLNKTDLPEGADASSVRAHSAGTIEVSLSGVAGVTTVQAALAERVRSRLGGRDFPAATRLRHRARLERAVGHVRRAAQSLAEPELAAEDLRLAARALAQVTGRVDAEQVLDVVFSTFCIGK